MKPRSRFSIWLAGILACIAAATLLSTAGAAAPRKIIGDVCRVSDPSPPLNVRTTPNGSVVRTLSNGTVITVLQHSEDKQWAYVGREDRSALGWVYSELIDCTAETSASASESAYSVGGLALGGKVHFNSNEYRKYDCNPSDQFDGFTWCMLKKQEREPRGSYNVSYSMLHSRDGSAYYINRFQEPAFWDDNEVSDDIARLSRKWGKQPRILKMPSKPGLGDGVIALWGDVELQPLDNESRRILAADKNVKRGVLIDFIGNYTRSAREDLPLYRLTGGAGFVWIASNKNGRGTIRFLAINPSEFDGKGGVALDIKETQRLCHSGDPSERLKACSIIIDGKGFGSRVDLATALDARCWGHNDLKEYELGLADCNASIALHPKFSYAYTNLATSLMGLGRVREAITALTKAIELLPTRVGNYIGRGRAFWSSGDKESAKKDFEYALTIDPSNEEAKETLATVYVDFGTSLMGLKRSTEAVAAYTKSLDLKPNLIDAPIGRGRAFLALGNKEAARKDFEQALIMEPTNQEVMKELASMDSSVTSGSNSPPSDVVRETNPRPTVEEAKPRPVGIQDTPTPSRWDSLAEFLRFFRVF